jgi:sulfatase modifying factor 1
MHETYYRKTPSSDPSGPFKGSSRVFRDGGWNGAPARCRSADRCRYSPDFRYYDLGFRVALVP